jgi:viologen exporter family transport system permease protein
MRPYLHIASTRFRTLLQYRGAALGGLFTQTFFGLTRIMILAAFYGAAVAPPGLPFADAVTYVWLGQAVLLLFPWSLDPEVRDSVRTGHVVYELCRPIDLHGAWLARALAGRTAPVLLRAVPMFAVAGLLVPALGFDSWRLPLPAGPLAGALWLASVAGAVLLSASLTVLIQISLFWTISGQGVPVLIGTFASILGGLIVPIAIFPDSLQPVLRALPFAGLLDHPARLYSGALGIADAPWVLAHQLGWSAICIASGRALLGHALRRVTLQGG